MQTMLSHFRLSASHALFILVLAGCADTRDTAATTSTTEAIPVRFDIRQVIGHTPDEVSAVLGPPSTETTARHDGREIPDLWYRADSVTIRYLDGKAQWVDVSKLSNLPFSPRALEPFGISETPPPSFANDHVIRWENNVIPGFVGVYIFPAREAGVDYVYFQHTVRP